MRMTTTYALAGAAGVLLLAPAAAQAQSWTGPYVGGSLGHAFEAGDDGESILFDRDLNGSFGDTVTTTTGANAFSTGFCSGAFFTAAPAGGCAEDDYGGELGLHAGYDWRFGSVVVGPVVEISDVDVRDDVSAFSTTPAGYVMSRELDSLAAARLRLGIALGRYLPYVTAGVARGEVSHRFSSTNTVNSFPERGDSEAEGHQLGVGVETQVGRGVSLGLEYLHTRLEDDDYRVRATGPAPATNPFLLGSPSGTDFRRSDGDFEFALVRFKAAYRF